MLATLVTTSSAIVVVPCSLCSVESPFAAAAGVFAKLEAVFSSAIVRSSSAELVRRGLSRISCSEIVPRFHEPETDADPTSPRPTQQAPSGGEPTFRFPYSAGLQPVEAVREVPVVHGWESSPSSTSTTGTSRWSAEIRGEPPVDDGDHRAAARGGDASAANRRLAGRESCTRHYMGMSIGGRTWKNERIPKVRRRRTANPLPATPRQARQQSRPRSGNVRWKRAARRTPHRQRNRASVLH